MSERVSGKVARINSDRELIINRGSAHGVEEGMTFRIKGTSVDVVDPDTGDQIGTVSKVKVLVRVEDVADKFCIARTFRTRRVNVGGVFDTTLSGLSAMLQPPKWETRVETFRRNPAEGESISEQDSLVAVGDVAEIAEEEDLDAVTMASWR